LAVTVSERNTLEIRVSEGYVAICEEKLLTLFW